MTRMTSPRIRIGVLALQGGVAEHLAALRALDARERAAGCGGVDAVPVKRAEDLAGADGVILPGGESSAVGSLLAESGLGERLRESIAAGLPAWGTCMGAILLARGIANDERRHLALMDIVVRRNAYGSQLDSFVEAAETDFPLPGDAGPFPMVFIRAPAIESVGPEVSVLARARGRIVACRQGAMIATTFHPELSADARFHAFFAALVRNVRFGASCNS